MMTNAKELWEKRWAEGQTRFHETAPNALLLAHAAALAGRKRILVPLAGRSFDLRWLAEQGHDVVGVEFVARAVTAFFADGRETPAEETLGSFPSYRAGGVTLVVGDMLDVTPEAVGTFDAIYDRAALVAIAPERRAAYVARCRALLREGGVTLLVALAYDDAKVAGPPFSVDRAAIVALFAGRTVVQLSTQNAEPTPRMRAAGVTLEESVYLVR